MATAGKKGGDTPRLFPHRWGASGGIPVLPRTIEADHLFGELCLCTTRSRTRGNTASALVACEAIEIKERRLGRLMLARMAGMSRSNVTVTMGRLRRRGLVRYQREGPLRVDVQALTVYLGRLAGGE